MGEHYKLTNNSGTSNVSVLNDLTDVVVSNVSNNQSLVCTNGIFSNQQIDH